MTPTHGLCRTHCPVCANACSELLLSRQSVPVHQNQVFTSVDAARGIARGDIEFRFCPACGFGWNARFDPSLLEYGVSYESDQSGSQRFLDHVRSRIVAILGSLGSRTTVVEIGCGAGYFLSQLCTAGNLRGLGVDTAYRGPERSNEERIEFRAELLDRHSRFDAEILVCRHVIEHVADPVSFARAATTSLERSPDPVLYFETPALEWILESGTAWDIFYEHCSLFSEASLRQVFAAVGFSATTCDRVFGGQYHWIDARRADSTPRAKALTPDVRGFPERVSHWLARWQTWLDHSAQDGPVAIWGAAAKGATFVNLFDPDKRRVQYLVDINPKKAGGFVPGTGHPIVPPAFARDQPVKHILVVNPLYVEEVRGILSSMGVGPRLHTAE